METNKVVLEVKDFSYQYGQIRAVNNISFYVNKGEIVTLIGGNGAGKTSTLRAISGLIKGGEKGQINFENKPIIHLQPHKITELGIAQCLEGRQVFSYLTVKENLQMGAYLRKDKQGIKDDLEYAHTLFPRLMERDTQLAGTLSGGEQQMLAVARGLMMRPKLLMMDEPSLGLAPIIINEIFKIIKKINSDGMTILLVEQNSNAALSVADRAYVIETGSVIMEGKAEELKADERIKKSYLGLS